MSRSRVAWVRAALPGVLEEAGWRTPPLVRSRLTYWQAKHPGTGSMLTLIEGGVYADEDACSHAPDRGSLPGLLSTGEGTGSSWRSNSFISASCGDRVSDSMGEVPAETSATPQKSPFPRWPLWLEVARVVLLALAVGRRHPRFP